jgi:hypothetical protein
LHKEKKIVYLIVSIDTEEDDWAAYKPTGHQLTNIASVPELHQLFDRYQIKPTYLIDYPVAADETHRDFFRMVLDKGRAEIGAHMHPWNTPPFKEELSIYNSMMKNLPSDLQRDKIINLSNLIEEKFGMRPTSFRAGRFCLTQLISSTLLELNYSVDSSVTPFINWEAECGGINFYGYPYYPYQIPLKSDAQSHKVGGRLWEVPITIGFNHLPFKLYASIYDVLSTNRLKRLRLCGMAHRLGFLRKIWLSPELSSHKEMKQLSKAIIRLGISVLNLFFHSTSLAPGLSPFVKTDKHKRSFFTNLELFFLWLHDNYDLKPIFLSEYCQIAYKYSNKNLIEIVN